MNAWVLIWILQGGLNLSPTASATFNDQASCLAARNWLLGLDLNNHAHAECFPTEAKK